MKRLLLLMLVPAICLSCDTEKKRIEKAGNEAISYMIHICIDAKCHYQPLGSLMNSLDSVFCYPFFSPSQEKEYVGYEKGLSIAHMYEKGILWRDEMKEKYNYADSVRFFTHKIDSMAALSGRITYFMGYTMSTKLIATRMNNPEDTIRATITLYFPPDISSATMERDELRQFIRPIDKRR